MSQDAFEFLSTLVVDEKDPPPVADENKPEPEAWCYQKSSEGFTKHQERLGEVLGADGKLEQDAGITGEESVKEDSDQLSKAMQDFYNAEVDLLANAPKDTQLTIEKRDMAKFDHPSQLEIDMEKEERLIDWDSLTEGERWATLAENLDDDNPSASPSSATPQKQETLEWDIDGNELDTIFSSTTREETQTSEGDLDDMNTDADVDTNVTHTTSQEDEASMWASPDDGGALVFDRSADRGRQTRGIARDRLMPRNRRLR